MHPGVAIDTPRDGVAASQDGDRCIRGWHPGIAIDASRMVIMHPRMVTIASRDGDLEMAIDVERNAV